MRGPEADSNAAKWVYIEDAEAGMTTGRGDDAVTTLAGQDAVVFNGVTNTFVGSPTDLDVTAVLIGDVTSSYNGPAPDDNTGEEMAHYLEMMVEEGFTDAQIVETAAVAGETNSYAASAAEDVDSIIYLGADSGVHFIDGFAFDSVADVSVATQDADLAEFGAMFSGAFVAELLAEGEVILAVDPDGTATSTATAIDAFEAAFADVAEGEEAAYVGFLDWTEEEEVPVEGGPEGATTSVSTYYSAMAINMDRDTVFDITEDIMIVVENMDFGVMPDPGDPDLFMDIQGHIESMSAP